MLIDSGASHCILKDGVLDTSQMQVIQVSARGFDGSVQQRLVPSCDLADDCDSMISLFDLQFTVLSFENNGCLKQVQI
ncbi:unnamed protein product [Phytophthora lilii]|uniref:Unnamed protein product n=1 Tax=Phytophthora lilii TaxID=2077276 RepID=A0A9W6TYA5_9STRA|nr:unnamed protein product [Phytophthora lilii]